MTPRKKHPFSRPKRVAEPASPVTATPPSPTTPAASPAAPARAKLFWNGRSQAVRLPKDFRFEGEEVAIRREGARVILEPITKRDWPPGYWERLAELTRDFDFPDVEPLGGHLLDVPLDADS